MLYRHVKTGGIYKFLGTAIIEGTLDTAVIYQSISDKIVWTRPAKQFFDGRFVKIQEVSDD